MTINKPVRYAAIAAIALGTVTFSQSASAQLSVNATGNVTVTVDNNITVTPVLPIDFGTVSAISSNTKTATLAINTSDTLTPTNDAPAAFFPDAASTPTSGTFDVEGPNGVTLTITLPAAPVAVNQGGACVGTAPDFTLDTFVSSPAGTLTGLGTGTPVTVSVGATLKTDPATVGTVAYESCAHVGTYTFTVAF